MTRTRTRGAVGSASQMTCLALLAVVIAASGLSAQPASTPSKKRDDLLRVSFVDIGQGDAIWIQGPRKHNSDPPINILIDGGPNASSQENHLLDYFERYDFPPGSTIDYMILTHPHTDHFDGLLDVLGKYKVTKIIDAGFPKDSSPSYQAFLKAADTSPERLVRAHASPEGSITLDWEDPSAPEGAPNLHGEILTAYWQGAATFGKTQNTKENNCSTVVRMEFGLLSFVFMGDAEGQQRGAGGKNAGLVEELLLENFKTHPEKLAATVLKPGHHGSDTGSTLPFIRAVHPAIVVVTSGRKKFGSVFLPDKVALDRYRSELPGTTILRTDRDDAAEQRDTTNDADGDDVYLYTDGQSLRAYQARRVQGKWRWVLERRVQPGTPGDPD